MIFIDPKKVVTLYPACGARPTIKVYNESVRIGEEGNRVTLKKDEWNDVVDKVQRGELGQAVIQEDSSADAKFAGGLQLIISGLILD